MTAYVVQSVQATGTATSLTGTLAAPVRAGNCVAVVAASNASVSNGHVTAVTLSSLTDNFSQIYTMGGTATTAFMSWWADPSSSAGGTVVSVTWAGVAGTASAQAFAALEIGGLYPVLPGLLDVAVAGTVASGTVYNSGTVLSTASPEIWIGAVSANSVPSGPAYPWVNLPVNVHNQVSYVLAPAAGTVSFAGTLSLLAGSNAGAVVLRGLPAAPSLPVYGAGAGPQQGDMSTLFTSPLGFFQQRAVFRAAQTKTTTTLPAGLGTTRVTVQYDTVFEDPYQGWNPNTFAWQAPVTGFYEVTSSVSVNGVLDACVVINTLVPAQTGLTAGLIVPAGGGVVGGSFYCYLVGLQDSVSIQAFAVSPGSSVPTVNNPPSTLEITWVASASA